MTTPGSSGSEFPGGGTSHGSGPGQGSGPTYGGSAPYGAGSGYGTGAGAGGRSGLGANLGSLSRIISAPRELGAWVLVGYAGLYLFFQFFQWILPGEAHGGYGTFTDRSASAAGGFLSLLFIALPIAAVLLASHVSPAVARAKLICGIALIEYVIALFFGFVTLLIGLGGVFDAVRTASDGFGALRYLVLGVAALILMAVAASVALRSYLNANNR